MLPLAFYLQDRAFPCGLSGLQRCVFDSNFTLYQLSYLGLLEVIRIRKSGYPVRMLDDEFVKKYRVLEQDPDKWPNSRDLCSAHGQPGEWQIGLTMVFMRDQMFSKLEGDRAKVIDLRVRGLQVSEMRRSPVTERARAAALSPPPPPPRPALEIWPAFF
eukprot:SAG22_NODE_433_length_10557_cov_6.586728_3_plen_159_part_00